MLGGMETILAFIRRHIGVKGDAADPAGSVHAKLGYLANRTIIKSIQRGTIALGQSDSTKTATINAVDPAKTMINFLGVMGADGSSSDNNVSHLFVRLELKGGGTNVTATRSASNDRPAWVSYEVIEFV